MLNDPAIKLGEHHAKWEYPEFSEDELRIIREFHLLYFKHTVRGGGKSGKELWASGAIDSWNHFSGLTVANGRVYLTGRDGKFVVIKDANQLEILASNKLEDRFDASPAAVGKQLLLRGHQNLYCIAE